MLTKELLNDQVQALMEACGYTYPWQLEYVQKMLARTHVRHMWPLTVKDTKCLLSHVSSASTPAEPTAWS